MQVRRSIFNHIKGNPKQQKALSLCLLLKYRCGRNSTIKDWTYNKLHNITSMSATTLRKLLPILIKNGWVHFSGKNNQHLVVGRNASHNKERNIRVDIFCFDSFKKLYNSVRALVALAVQHRKDFIRHTIQTCHNPKDNKELRKARKHMKRLVRMGVLKGMDDEYNELGLSYSRIAQETGNCIRTAQRIIKFAIIAGWCSKKQKKTFYQLKGISFREGYGLFTYASKDYIVIMGANRYSLKEDVSNCLGMVF